MIFQKIRKQIAPGTVLPGNGYTVKGFGKTRNGEASLVYSIRKRTAERQSQKNIAESEWERAYSNLKTDGEITRKSVPVRQPCDFAVIGKVFVVLGIADEQPAKYVLQSAVPAKPTERG